MPTFSSSSRPRSVPAHLLRTRGGISQTSKTVKTGLFSGIAILLLLAGLPTANAQAVSDTAFDRFMSNTYGNNTTVGFGSNGTPVSSTDYALGRTPTATAAPAASGGGLDYSRTVPIKTGDKYTDTTAKVPISKSGMGKAFAAAAMAVAGGKLGLAFFAGSAIYDWMTAAGVRRNAANDGFERKDTTVCTVAPCYNYRYTLGGSTDNAYYSTHAAACSAAAASNNASEYYALAQNPRVEFYAPWNNTTCLVDFYYRSGGAFISTSRSNVNSQITVSPSPASWLSVALSDIGQYMDDPVMAPPYAKALEDTGISEARPMPDAGVTPTVTGPAVAPRTPTTTTTTTTDGITTETKQCDIALTYSGDTVTQSESCQVTRTNPDGTTSTASVTAPPKVEIETCGLPGTPACKIDESGTPEKRDLSLDTSKLDTESAAARNKITGTSDKNFFSSWGTFFSVPPLVSCVNMDLPQHMEWTLPTIDTCQVIDPVRAVMAWIWGFVAFWASLGMVRRCF